MFGVFIVFQNTLSMKRYNLSMPKNNNQLNKSLAILQLLLSRTDDDHVLNARDIETLLYDAFGIEAEYRSILRDINQLIELFDTPIEDDLMDHVKETEFPYSLEYDARNDKKGYHILDRPLSYKDIQLLIEAVTSSKTISNKTADHLIDVISSQRSIYEKDNLIVKNDLYVHGRSERDDDNIIKYIKQVNTAIENNHKISYKKKRDKKVDDIVNIDLYVKQFEDKDKRDFIRFVNFLPTQEIELSPFRIFMDDGDYYILCTKNVVKNNKTQIDICTVNLNDAEYIKETSKPREGKEAITHFDLKSYIKKRFSKDDYGVEELVMLKCERSYSVVKKIADKFGYDCFVKNNKDKDHVIAAFHVFLCKEFFAWISSFEDSVEIIGSYKCWKEYAAFISNSAGSIIDSSVFTKERILEEEERIKENKKYICYDEDLDLWIDIRELKPESYISLGYSDEYDANLIRIV